MSNRQLEQLQARLAALEESASSQPAWSTQALEQLEQRLLDQMRAQWPTSQPVTLEETVSALEKTQTRALERLVEQLTTSLQTAIAVQLAPLSDDLPDRLQSALAAAVPASLPPLPMAMPELAKEIEKFETRSMASMAARMTTGLQTALSQQWSGLTACLPELLAEAISKIQPPAFQGPATPPALASSGQRAAIVADARLLQQLAELTEQLEQARTAQQQTEALLAEAIELEHAAPANPATASADGSSKDLLAEALRAEVAELRSLLSLKERDSLLADELRHEMNRLRDNQTTSPDSSGDDGELRERLEVATCQIIDLRSQNEELNEQIARLQINFTPHGHMPHLGQEGLSWEERKKLLLEQLNAELSSDDPPAADEEHRLKIQDVIQATDAEIARRDRELAELRSLLAQQADAHEGLAVGAAAVAQLVESDELVQEEREKLRNLQKSWDEKLRQAEIDLSMERAKMARERLQLEEQKQELEAALQTLKSNAANAANGDPKDKAPADKGRKWLSRLGLKEEK